MAGSKRGVEGLIFVVTVSILLGAGMANKDWHFGNGFNNTNWGWGINKNASNQPKHTQPQGPNKDWNFGNGFNNTNWGWGINKNASDQPKHTQQQGPNKIIVGGSEHWHFGFNYSEWAFKNGPYFVNDTLVFKYDAPNSTTFPHSVYLFPNVWSYLKCDLKRAKRVANWTQGSTGEGFEFVLNKWQPYYFGCGEHDGIHCRDGGMKFFVVPMLRWWHK